MLKPSSPSPQAEDPADGEADGTDTAKSQGGTASRGAKVPRRYEVPEADALSELPNHPHAQTVRGQIQRVRLDLLARENERLDHQLRELRQQQEDYQEKDSTWREGWQKRLLDLSEQVDHLISAAEASREAEPERDEGPELRDTVKPLLLAVLEMLDDPDGQGRPVGIETARAAASRAVKPIDSVKPIVSKVSASPAELQPQAPQTAPVASPAVAERDQAPVIEPAAPATDEAEGPTPTAEAAGLDPLADKALPETRPALASTGRMESWDPAPAPPKASPSDIPLPEPVEAAEPVQAKPPAEPAPRSQVSSSTEAADNFDRAQKTSPDDEISGGDMAIEIARLLLPQDDPGDNDDLLLEPKESTGKDVAHEAPRPQDDPRDETDQSSRTLVLGTSETPEIALPQPTAAESTKPKTAEASPVDALRPDLSRRGKGSPSRNAASGQDRPAARRTPTAGGQPVAGEDAKASDTGSLAKPQHPEPEPETPTEPLPRCLTERWEDVDPDSVLSSGRGQPARRRDKGSYRWPFRRLRATIDHDHSQADSDSEPDAGSRPRGTTRFGEKLE